MTVVRELTSGAIASTTFYRYGTVKAEIRPPNVSGIVTGMFLHRNGPRQEIHIKFLGKDTSKMLVNVFCNPGPERTKLEYGHRGTPTLIDLGFDTAESFHSYEIDGPPNAIRRIVDGAEHLGAHADTQPTFSIRPQPLALTIEEVRREPFIGAPSGHSGLPISRDPQLRAYRDRRTG